MTNIDQRVAEVMNGLTAPVPPQDPDEPTQVEIVRSRLLTTDQLRKIPPPEFLINPLLPQPGVGLLYGPPTRGKTFLSIAWALSVGTGTPWEANGGYAVQRGLVIYVAAEGAHGLAKRVQAWEAWNGCTADGVLWYPQPVSLITTGSVVTFADAVAPHEPALIILDTLARCSVGGDENSAKDMGLVVESLGFLARELNCTTLGVHHSRKDGSEYRGSSALLGAVDTAIELTGDGRSMSLSCFKQKDAAPFPPVELELHEVEVSCVLRGVAVTTTGWERSDDLLDLICQVAATEAIATGRLRTMAEESLKIPERSYYRLIGGLVEKGFAQNVGSEKRALYRPTPMGLGASRARTAT